MEYIDNDPVNITIKTDSKGKEYFYCLNCWKKVYLDDVENAGKYWDDDGNHRMWYRCNLCDHDNYE